MNSIQVGNSRAWMLQFENTTHFKPGTRRHKDQSHCMLKINILKLKGTKSKATWQGRGTLDYDYHDLLNS